MSKKKKMGSDPLSWIKETKEESIQSNQSIQKIQSIQENKISAKVGLKQGWTRATVIVKEDNLEKIKALAFLDRKHIKELLDEALNLYLEKRKDMIEEALTLIKQ